MLNQARVRMRVSCAEGRMEDGVFPKSACLALLIR